MRSISLSSFSRPGDRILIAVSGGADSMALLHALFEQRDTLGLFLTVAHFNHALRPEALSEQLFVQKAAQQLKIPFVTDKCSRKPPSHGSLEAFAREQRYHFLKKAAKKTKSDYCVTAHTLDDQAETVLMRLIRGTGLTGLQGVLLSNEIFGLKVIRPFLNVTRKEIEVYLRSRNVAWVEDPSNRSRQFQRNLIRHDLLPYIEKHFAHDIKQSLGRLAKTSAEDVSFIEHKARSFFDKHVKKSRTRVRIPIGFLQKYPLAIRRVIFRMAIDALKGDLNSITLSHIEFLEGLVDKKSSREILFLPSGIRCYKNIDLILEIKRSRV